MGWIKRNLFKSPKTALLAEPHKMEYIPPLSPNIYVLVKDTHCNVRFSRVTRQ